MNMQDFYTGHAFDAYEFFGAHTYFGGTHFAVWAPSAQHIAVETEIGTFDLHRTQSAVWECDAPGVQAGMGYQYWVRTEKLIRIKSVPGIKILHVHGENSRL